MLPLVSDGHGSYWWTPGMKQEIFSPDQLIGGNLKLVTSGETFAQSASPYMRGTVVGRITESDLLTVCVSTAKDGSQIPCGVVVDRVDATQGNAAGHIYVQGEFNANHVLADQDWTDAALKAAMMAGPGNMYLKSALSNNII